jgi:hypothetical protein
VGAPSPVVSVPADPAGAGRGYRLSPPSEEELDTSPVGGGDTPHPADYRLSLPTEADPSGP